MIVETPSGPVRGRPGHGAHGDVVEFLGVPHAHAERFGPPRPTSWTAPLDATAPGPIAPQLPARVARVTGPSSDDDARQGEDCLRVDVRAPAAALSDGGGRPVLVWVHGGAYVIGAATTSWYDTTRLVAGGDVVTVNVGYRLGVLGWLRHPGVSPGNLGLLDVLAALTWVRGNIAAFGGDPDRVTAAGQSAGAHAIASLLTVPSARGLIGRAVLQSGQLGLGFCSERRAARVARSVLDALDGADPATVEVPVLLRAQRRAMIDAAGPGGVNSSPAFAPVAGVAPLSPGASWSDTATAGRPLLVGATADEARTFVAISPGLERARRLPVLRRGIDTGTALATRRVFGAPAARLADDAARTGTPVWRYSFEFSAPGSDLGACHCIELPFLFGTREAWEGAPMLAGTRWDTDVAPLGDDVRAAWLAFARGGDPDPDGRLGWRRHDAGGGPGIRFGHEPALGTRPPGLGVPGTLGESVPGPRRRSSMALIRRVATLGAVVAAARSYARQNPEKVNRYADKAAEFVNTRTGGKYRKQVDSALRGVRRETHVPGRPTVGDQGYRAPNPTTPNDRTGGSYYPSSRADRP